MADGSEHMVGGFFFNVIRLSKWTEILGLDRE